MCFCAPSSCVLLGGNRARGDLVNNAKWRLVAAFDCGRKLRRSKGGGIVLIDDFALHFERQNPDLQRRREQQEQKQRLRARRHGQKPSTPRSAAARRGPHALAGSTRAQIHTEAMKGNLSGGERSSSLCQLAQTVFRQCIN